MMRSRSSEARRTIAALRVLDRLTAELEAKGYEREVASTVAYHEMCEGRHKKDVQEEIQHIKDLQRGVCR